MKKLSVFIFVMQCLVLSGVSVMAAEEGGGGGEIVFNAPAVGVTFSHETHVNGMGLDCESCHDGIFAMEAGAAESAGNFTMASMEKGLYCGACHDGSNAFSVAGDCSSCHGPGEAEIYYTEPVKSVLFSHQAHVGELGFGCADCHSGMFAMKALEAQKNADFTMESLYQGKYCGACHDGSSAFASNTRCASCHVGVKGFKRAFSEQHGKVKKH